MAVEVLDRRAAGTASNVDQVFKGHGLGGGIRRPFRCGDQIRVSETRETSFSFA